jgi:hypothetical protein
MREVRAAEPGSFRFERMKRLSLVDDVLQHDGICHQFVVDDGLLLIRWIVRSQEAVFAEG